MTDNLPSLPVDADFIFVANPVKLDKLKAILEGIESTLDTHPVDDIYPTNRWVTHVYAAVTKGNKEGLAILFDVKPVGDTGQQPVQVAKVEGTDENAKAQKAQAIIGAGNELIGYEDLEGQTRVVIFRVFHGTAVDPTAPDKLSWNTSDHPERVEWSKTLIGLASQQQTQLEIGNPEGFIAGYNGLKPNGMKVKFWAELLVAMAKFESDWKPTNVFAEPSPLNENSIGLLQLSLKDQQNYHLTPQINNENELKAPLLNLRWSVAIFSHLLSKDTIIASGTGNASKGAARYWSVLRTGHKIELIRALTRHNIGL